VRRELLEVPDPSETCVDMLAGEKLETKVASLGDTPLAVITAVTTAARPVVSLRASRPGGPYGH
jgi:hypothetical protein